MNGFDQVNQTITMRTDIFDELRIIAGDPNKLTPSDREVVRRAADEWETLGKILIATNMALIESQQMRIALNEQLIEARKINPPAHHKLEMPLYRGTVQTAWAEWPYTYRIYP